MEYLFVSRLLHGDDMCLNVILTDQMKRFVLDRGFAPQGSRPYTVLQVTDGPAHRCRQGNFVNYSNDVHRLTEADYGCR